MARRRLLIAHLFLPETLHFQAWPDEQAISHYRVPSQAKGGGESGQSLKDDVPPSPPLGPTDERVDLSIEELDSRLKRASIGNETTKQKDGDYFSGGIAESNDEAVSDSESAPAPLRSRRTPHSNRGSFSDQSKKVNMTSLMSEAASGGDAVARSRRGSANMLPPPPSMLVEEPEGTSIPVAPASDHGRAATTSITPAHPHSAGAGSIGVAKSQSRRGSVSAGGSHPGSLSIPPSATTTLDKQYQKDGISGGTRTPGAAAGGKAGMMTPLSIIGDLKAKRSAIPAQQQPTPGDTDRHHPFGSGAVTPMREGAPLGAGSRTPGPRPALNASPFSRATVSGLQLTKVNENTNPSDRLLGSRTPGSTARPGLTSQSRTVTEGRVPRVAPQGAFTPNDHGRSSSIGGGAPTSKPTRPGGGLGSRTHSQVKPFQASTAQNLLDDNQIQSPFAAGQKSSNRKAESSTILTPPAAAPTSVNYGRSASKTRSGARQSMIGRRPSSIGGRSTSVVNRRMSSDTVGEDAATQDGETDSPPILPPYDFVPNPSSNGGLINAVRSLHNERIRGGKMFIGTPGVSTSDWAGVREQEHISERMRHERDYAPVWLDDDVFEGAYAHFCKQILWPTFHYTLPTRKGLDYEHEGFECYRQLNERFAEAIVREYKEGDIIFVNDYHLLLVPEMVREKLPHAKMAFFLHIAWPSSEIFRCLSARTHILKGMLGADLVGFQTANFARHFRQTVSRILQLEATPKGIQIDGRGGFVTVGVFPIGIDVETLNERRKQPDVKEWVEKLESRYEGKKIIVGRDKLDSIKGVRQKLLAFEAALNEHPDLVGQIVLLQVALATTEENEEVAAATEVVSRINNKFSTLTYQPVVFLHVQDITFCQYLALLTVADAFLATSLREGMNLTSHEFVICQEFRRRPLILSEFTGTYSSLRACIGINPYNTKQVADAIFKAITMDEQEAHERWKDLHRQVTVQDSRHWIQSLLGRLERAYIDQQRRNNSFVPRLEIGQSEWRASKSRLILLDLEGTLMRDDPLMKHEHGFQPSDELVQLLLDLTDDAKNRVYVLSGMGSRDLDKLSERVPRIGLVAENGCAVMYAGSAPLDTLSHIRANSDATTTMRANDDREGSRQMRKTWTSLVDGTNMSWRESVIEILAYFTERTPGSWLEDRGASILWRFWSKAADVMACDAKEFEWARRQAAEVQNLIYDSLGERFSLRIIPSKTSFLIMPKNTSRASATQHIVSLSHVGVQHGFQGAVAASCSPVKQTQLFFPSSDYSSLSEKEKREEREREKEQEEESVRSPLPLLSAPMLGAQDSSAIMDDSIKTFRQPSNAWSMEQRSPEQPAMRSVKTQHGSAYNAYGLHPYGLGSFDLVLCVGQDDGLFDYINALDLPFAPITCTSAGSGADVGTHGNVGIGSEANYYLDGPEDVLASIREILAFRGRDQRWGVPAMVDV